MGHANKGSSSQNNHWWQDGEVLTISNATVSIPDSYGFVLVTNPGGTAVTTFDTEWFFGRVIEFTLHPSSPPFSFLKTGGNIWTNGLQQPAGPNSTVRFRAARTAAGAQIWLQVGFQSIT